jgi:para-nitrobenzyl esterase
MIGWTREEAGYFFASNDSLIEATEDQALKKYVDEFGEVGKQRYGRGLKRRIDARTYTTLVDPGSDKLIMLPSIELPTKMQLTGSSVFAHRFDYHSPHAERSSFVTGHCPLGQGVSLWVDAFTSFRSEVKLALRIRAH